MNRCLNDLHRVMHRAAWCGLIAAIAACFSEFANNSALAQETDAQPAPPATLPQTQSQTPPQTQPGSLDDLLGIDEESQEQAGEAAAREADEELKQKLNEAEIADGFSQAVQKMSLSADLLDVRFDPGLGTQRVQEDILAKLAHLIDQAKKSQSMSQSSSSSSSSSQSQSKSQQSKQNPGQQKSQPQNTGNERNNKPSDSQEGDPPPMQQGDINTVLEESRAEWGSLPPRVRDQLLQGRKEKFSSLYQQLTQEYYKRLAEEGSP